MVEGALALTVLAIVLGGSAWLGFTARADDRTLQGFVAAPNSQSGTSIGLSLFASGLGAWILFAPPEVGAGVGVVAVAGYAVGAALPYVLFALLGDRIRTVVPAGMTLTRYIRVRFGRGFHLYVIAIALLYMLVFVTAELTAVGGIAAILTTLEPRVVIIGVALTTLAYTAYGGLRASIRTDRWQGWLILILGAIAFTVAFSDPEISWSGAWNSSLMKVDRLGIEVAVTLVIAVAAANVFHHGYWQRVWAARDLPSLHRGSWIAIAATAPIVMVLGLIGVIAAASAVDIGTPPVPFFALISGTPAWVGAAVFAAGVTLVASSVDTLENAIGAVVVGESERAGIGAARVVTVVLLIPAVIVALQGFSVLRLFLIADLLCAATAVPALSSLSRWASARGAISGAIAGLGGAIAPGVITTGSVSAGIEAATFPGAVPGFGQFAGALGASTVVLLAVSLIARSRHDQAPAAPAA